MSPRGRIASGALAVLAAVAGCWLALLAPKRTQMSDVRTQITKTQARAAAANAAVAQAEQARGGAERDAKLLAGLTKAVPEDEEVGPLVRQLDAIAKANKIDFRSAKLTAGAGDAAAAPAPAEAEGGSTEGKDDAKGGAESSEAPAAAAVTQPPPGAAVGEAGLLTVPFSFTFDGGYAEMQRFLAAVHGLAKSKRGQISVRGRLITVDGFSLGPGRDGFPKVTALVSATAYALPKASAATPPTAAAEPQAATTAPGTP